jgi:hypothetical protein
MVEKRERRRRDGTSYAVWRTRWRDERGIERSKTFDRASDARAFEATVRTLKRSGALADLDAGTETLADFVEEWWLVYAGPNLERSTRSCGTDTRCRDSGRCASATSRRRPLPVSGPSSRRRVSASRRSARR